MSLNSGGARLRMTNAGPFHPRGSWDLKIVRLIAIEEKINKRDSKKADVCICTEIQVEKMVSNHFRFHPLPLSLPFLNRLPRMD